jgi:uncharacterized protein (DUF1778 family)
MDAALTVRLSERQSELVARAAAEEGRSRGQIIRRAIDAALASRPGEDPARRRMTGEGK